MLPDSTQPAATTLTVAQSHVSQTLFADVPSPHNTFSIDHTTPPNVLNEFNRKIHIQSLCIAQEEYTLFNDAAHTTTLCPTPVDACAMVFSATRRLWRIATLRLDQ